MPDFDKQSSPTSGDQNDASAAQAKVTEMAGQVQAKTQEGVGQLQDRLREQLDQRSTQAAAQINEQASDLRSVSESLKQQGKDGPAKAADRLAQYAERVGGYLHEKGSDELLADAEDFGRRKPMAVVAGGVALGLAASRFLKASSTQRYQSRAPRAQESWPQQPPAGLVPPVGSVPAAAPYSPSGVS